MIFSPEETPGLSPQSVCDFPARGRRSIRIPFRLRDLLRLVHIESLVVGIIVLVPELLAIPIKVYQDLVRQPCRPIQMRKMNFPEPYIHRLPIKADFRHGNQEFGMNPNKLERAAINPREALGKGGNGSLPFAEIPGQVSLFRDLRKSQHVGVAAVYTLPSQVLKSAFAAIRRVKKQRGGVESLGQHKPFGQSL